MTEGRTRSYTDADGFSRLKQETRDLKLPIFEKQQPLLQRGTLGLLPVHVGSCVFSSEKLGCFRDCKSACHIL